MEKKCNCNEPYDSDAFEGGYPRCPVHDALQEKKYPIGDITKLNILKKHYFNYYRPSFPSDERTAEVVNNALCIKEETEAIFKAMDEYAATPQGIGWVKASERLPENGGWYFVRAGKLKDKYIWPRMELLSRHKEGVIFEWLDESQPQAVDAIAFAEWAKEEGWVCKKGVGWMKHSDETPYVLTSAELFDLFKARP